MVATYPLTRMKKVGYGLTGNRADLGNFHRSSCSVRFFFLAFVLERHAIIPQNNVDGRYHQHRQQR